MAWGENAWLALSGLWLGALAWGTSTQLNYSLVPWQCDSGTRITPWIAAGLVLLALAGTAASWQSFRHRHQRFETNTPAAGTPFEMLAIIGIVAGILFALITALQGGAALIVMRCAP